MIESFKENVNEKMSVSKNHEFDRDAEKERRKEIRSMLIDAITAALQETGFKKTRYSLWSRHIGEIWHLVYLQRSQTDHRYYIEAGICYDSDIPQGEKTDIIFCKNRERIEWIVANVEKKQMKEHEDADEKIKEKINNVRETLDFEIPDAHEKYPKEYFVPSVSLREAEEKIEKIKNDIKKIYIIMVY